MGSLLEDVAAKYDTYDPSPVQQPKPAKKLPKSRAAVSAAGDGSSKRMATRRKAAPLKKPPVKRVPPKKEGTMIFGIDIGTTQVTSSENFVMTDTNMTTRYTGFAYTWSGRPNAYSNIDHISKWSRNSIENRDKVPSAITFGSVPVWGSAAVGAEGALEWFKLLLAGDDVLPQDVKDSEQLRKVRVRARDLDKSAVDIISSFLRHVWEHAMEVLKSRIGGATINLSKHHVVITVPAIWTDAMNDTMRQAVTKAGVLEARPGITKSVLTFIAEPEAAAIATLADAQGRSDIEIGDIFVVVDCGGGTVDIISYKATRTEPMEVTEVVKGEGGLHGAIFVEERVQSLFQDKVLQITRNALNNASDKDIKQLMTKYWVTMRDEFTSEQRTWDIEVPRSFLMKKNKHPVIGFSSFTVTSSELEEAFRPVVTKIAALVDGQVEAVRRKEMKLPKYIILVGGFGQCRYLFEYLRKQCAAGVEILQPGSENRASGPWTAVCHGAVMRGLEKEKVGKPAGVRVRSRVARASYGVICQEKWDDLKHEEEHKIWDEDEQIFMSVGQMQWLVKEGAEVTSQQTFSHNFYKLFRDRPQILCTTIYKCASSQPPDRKDASVIKHFELKWNPQINFASLDRFVNNRGESFSQLDYTAEMVYVGGDVEFRILHNGRKQAAKNVSMEF